MSLMPPTRRPATHLPAIWRAALFAGSLLLVGAFTQQATASILTGKSLAGAEALSLDDLEARLAEYTADDASTEGGMTGAAEQDELPMPAGPAKAPANPIANFSPTPGSAGGSTTSSTSSSGASGGVTPAVMTPPAALLLDEPPAERYAAECALLLPDAPGLELLRPPRA